MYDQTPAQIEVEKALMKKGFNFSNWIAHDPNGDGSPREGTESLGTMIMIKKSRHGREIVEVEPDGTIN